MTNFILYINLAQLIVCWFLLIPAFFIQRFTKKLSEINYLKIGIFSTGFLSITDLLQLIVFVFTKQPISFMLWLYPIIFAFCGTYYHAQYLSLKEATLSSKNPSKEP